MNARIAVLVSVVLVGCGPQPGSEADADLDAPRSSEVTEALTVGDWTGFTGGQCVHGVYQFYLHRYGISLTGACAQPGNLGTCQNCGACMIWESGAVQPSPALFNRYAWGTAMPQTYDIVVYPPRSGTGPGHVACVDHLASGDANAWGSLYVMDSNYAGNELQASAPHTVSRAPYGFYRLKSLDHQSQAPRGYVDGADCSSVSGWSQDTDAPDQALSVDLYFGGPAGSGVPAERIAASAARPDLCTAIGSCNHGYRALTPRGLMDGAAHDIHVYGIDANGSANAELLGSPKAVTCSAAETGVRRHIGSPAVLTAWGFDTFMDVRPVADATFASHAEAADWPAAPELIQATGAPAVYVVDGDLKRWVPDPSVAAAWHLDLSRVKALPPAQVEAMPTGPALRARPMLIKASGPSVDVLDDAPPAPDAGPPAPPRPDAGPDAGAEDDATPDSPDWNTPASHDLTGTCASVGGLDLLSLGAALAWARRRRVSLRG